MLSSKLIHSLHLPIFFFAIYFSMDRSLIPSFLYSTTSSTHKRITEDVSSVYHVAAESPKFMIPSPNESGRRNIKLFSRDYYLACAVGGSICCGFTHMAVTPLDLVKCNMQVGLFLFILFPFALKIFHDFYIILGNYCYRLIK